MKLSACSRVHAFKPYDQQTVRWFNLLLISSRCFIKYLSRLYSFALWDHFWLNTGVMVCRIERVYSLQSSHVDSHLIRVVIGKFSASETVS